MTGKSLVCWKCGESLKDVPRPITRHSNCPACYAELHCCVMCKSYDSRFPNRCSDERADPPVYKDTANFCEYFKPKPGAYDPEQDRASREAKAELQALFGGDGEDGEGGEPGEKPDGVGEEPGDEPMSEEEKARRELEKLFRK